MCESFEREKYIDKNSHALIKIIELSDGKLNNDELKKIIHKLEIISTKYKNLNYSMMKIDKIAKNGLILSKSILEKY